MMKDFLRIFQFLYNKLDPGHKVWTDASFYRGGHNV